MKRVVIIVFALAMLQGFLHAHDDPEKCIPAIREIFEKLGVDFQLFKKVIELGPNCTGEIKKVIRRVELKIDGSPANNTKCLNKLSKSLDKINATYEADLDALFKSLADNKVGRRINKFSAALGECVQAASKCSDIADCHDKLKKVLYKDESVTKDGVNELLRDVKVKVSNKSERIISDVREIRANITLCN